MFEIAFRFLRFKGDVNTALEKHYERAVGGKDIPGRKAVVELPFVPRGHPKVSLIILTLDGAPLLEALLVSFFEINTWKNFEILVMNHGCDIETQTCLDSWAERLPIREIRLLKNYSFAFSCNRAAEIAKGEVLIFLNNDVVVQDDFVPRMCAAVTHAGGLAGMKLYHQIKGGSARAPHHIGVRFRWDIRRCWTSPYNATPSFVDADYERKPTQMPAVTAAILCCRREEFMDIGGFHEGYVYGFEDVDLCLKFRIGKKASLVSLNDISARHGEGATRLKRASSKRRKAWYRYNSSLFRQRFGLLMRRDLYAGVFDGDGGSCGRRAVVGIAAEEAAFSADIKRGLQTSFVRNVRDHFPTLLGYNLFGVDLFVSLDPIFDIARARHVHPAMITVAFIVADDPRWTAGVCDHFDLLMASTEPLAAMLQVRFGRPVSVLPLSEHGFNDSLIIAVRQFTGERHKISVELPTGDLGAYERLKHALQADGHKVRLDSPGPGASRQKLRDDVVLWGRAPVKGILQEGSINIALFDVNASQMAIFDGVWPMSCGEQEPGYEGLKRIIETCVAERLRIPTDPPLTDRSNLPSEYLMDGWLEKPDPVRELLDM